MTLRTTMIDSLQAGLARFPGLIPSIRRHIRSCAHTDGGFAGKSSDSDLYYTVFAAEFLHAVEDRSFLPSIRSYLLRTDHTCSNLTELAALTRLYADYLPEKIPSCTNMFLNQLQKFCSPNRAYAINLPPDAPSVYACFLALGICQDLQIAFPHLDSVTAFMKLLRLPNGSYINCPGIPLGAVPSTAAALLTMFYLTHSVDAQAVQWLKAQFLPTGGCKAVSIAPYPDLLSTAVALHALKSTHNDVTDLSSATEKFIFSLYNSAGAFNPQLDISESDAEYTYYGLMALGDVIL